MIAFHTMLGKSRSFSVILAPLLIYFLLGCAIFLFILIHYSLCTLLEEDALMNPLQHGYNHLSLDYFKFTWVRKRAMWLWRCQKR